MEERCAGQDRWTLLLGGTILVGLSLALLSLVGRLIQINTSLAPRLNVMVRAQQTGMSVVPARRGCILDSNGRIIAGSVLMPGIFADPEMIEDPTETARQLAPVLGLPAGMIEQTITENRHRRFCWLKRCVDPTDAASVDRLKLPGIELRNESTRNYPAGSLMAPTLGIVSIDGRGLEGIEYQYDSHLSGEDGQQAVVYDGRRRRAIWSRTDLSKPVRDGGHVVLALDSVIQGFAEQHLSEAVDEFRADGGVAVVMDPRTGDVWAMAQVPTFVPSEFSNTPVSSRRNRVICDAVEPGSVFKPFVGCAAVMGGFVDDEEEIFCHNGVKRFGHRTMHDSSPHGWMDFKGIIAKSSNIGMGIIAFRMGNESIFDIVHAFGFGRATGTGFPGEANGLLRPLSKWTDYSTTSVPIGQEIAVTPLQLATAFSAIVNGGELLKPRLVRALLDADGRTVQSFEGPVVVQRVISEETADFMTRDVLVSVVTDGGGRPAALAEWQVLGKTGTAQVSHADRPGYERDKYIGSFIGAAPAEDPRVVVVVMIHKPDESLGYYGTKVAAPVVGRILSQTLSYLSVPSSRVLAAR